MGVITDPCTQVVLASGRSPIRPAKQSLVTPTTGVFPAPHLRVSTIDKCRRRKTLSSRLSLCLPAAIYFADGDKEKKRFSLRSGRRPDGSGILGSLPRELAEPLCATNSFIGSPIEQTRCTSKNKGGHVPTTVSLHEKIRPETACRMMSRAYLRILPPGTGLLQAYRGKSLHPTTELRNEHP